MNFGIVRNAALERWKQLADPCSHGQFIDLPDSGVQAPLVWQRFSYPISCQWQSMAGASGFGHVSIFCSVWEWAANLTDILLDYRFDAYPIGQPEVNPDQTVSEIEPFFLEIAPAILSRHYFRTLMLAAEILEDLTILRKSMSDDPGAKKNARIDLSQAPFGVDTLMKYVNTICKHKDRLHECNHHLPTRFLDEDPRFDPSHYGDWDFLNACIEVPRYMDIIETVMGAFNRVDQLLRQPDIMAKVGGMYGKRLGTEQEAPSPDPVAEISDENHSLG